MELNSIGRKEIFTDKPYIDRDNIIEVLQKAIIVHQNNKADMDFLLAFDAGIQPRRQQKVTRTEIDCIVVDSVANEVSTFWQSYFWSQPITMVQRNGNGEAISLLNKCYDAEGVESKTQKLGRFVEICGVGYSYIDLKPDYTDGDSYFQYEILDPRYTFIVRSSSIDHRPMVAVTYHTDDDGRTHYTAITKDSRFEIDDLSTIINGEKSENWRHSGRSGERNPFGIINIVEFIRNHDRTGVFEHEIDDMIDLNLNESNFSNGVAEAVNTIWVTTDVDLKETVVDENGNEVVQDANPKTGDWLHVYTTADGRTPDIKPLSAPFDSTGTMNYILAKRALILQKCYVPQRNDNSGGSTGIAMDTASGWTATELVAAMKEQITKPNKLNEVKVITAVLSKSPDIPADSPLKKIKYSDVIPNMKRMKYSDMNIKMNTYVAGVNNGIAPEHMIREINFFSDPQQVIEDSKPYMDKFLEHIYGKKETGMTDPSDNAVNSPLIDGMGING